MASQFISQLNKYAENLRTTYSLIWVKSYGDFFGKALTIRAVALYGWRNPTSRQTAQCAQTAGTVGTYQNSRYCEYQLEQQVLWVPTRTAGIVIPTRIAGTVGTHQNSRYCGYQLEQQVLWEPTRTAGPVIQTRTAGTVGTNQNRRYCWCHQNWILTQY